MSAIEMSSMTGRQIRALCRAEKFTGPTAGAALGYVQANLVILPQSFAIAFEEFCRRNPAPCPLIEMTRPGSFTPHDSAPDADLRTDLPRYRVYRNGVLVDRCTSVVDYWAKQSGSDPWVAFLIGCSFTFETALLRAGIPVRHIEEGKNVPMFRTTMACTPAGPFAGPMVVSMRPLAPANIDRVRGITARLPSAHGPPIYVGEPAAIGIHDLARPDYGDSVTIRPGEVPVFWACGVTPMLAIENARPPLAIVHEPGHMFVTDLREQ